MLEKGKISSMALLFMLMNVVGPTAIIFLPAVAAKYAKQDAWMTPIIATIPGVVVIILASELGRRFPGKTIIEYLPEILGNWLGTATGVLYLFFFIHTNGIIIREYGELMANIALPQTPTIVTHTSFVFLAAYAIRSGLEVIGRLLILILPAAIFAFFILLLFGLQEAKFNNLLPMLENGLSLILLGSVTPSAWRGEVIFLAMFLPYLVETQKGKLLGIWAVVLTGAVLVVDAAVNTAIFGPSTARLVFPTFEIANTVEAIGIFRVGVLFLSIWQLLSIWTKITMFYYVAVLRTAQLLKLKDYRPVVLPIGIILAAFSIVVVENSVRIPQYVTTGFPPFAYLVEWVIPLILLLIAIAKGFKPKY